MFFKNKLLTRIETRQALMEDCPKDPFASYIYNSDEEQFAEQASS